MYNQNEMKLFHTYLKKINGHYCATIFLKFWILYTTMTEPVKLLSHIRETIFQIYSSGKDVYSGTSSGIYIFVAQVLYYFLMPIKRSGSYRVVTQDLARP